MGANFPCALTHGLRHMRHAPKAVREKEVNDSTTTTTTSLYYYPQYTLFSCP